MNMMSKKVFFASLVVFLFSCSERDKSTNWTDSSLPSEKRVELILKEMTLEEKIGQMCQYVGEVNTDLSNFSEDEVVGYKLAIEERAELIREGKIGSFLKVPTYREANVLQELAMESRLKIPLLIAEDAIHGHGMYGDPVTIYPTQINLASSFDTTLTRKLAQYTAREMRATGYHWNFSPNIELIRDARWGRIGESFGEDPLLVSHMGVAMIEGYQGKDFSEPDNVVACAKHFVAGGIPFNGLNAAPADVSERTLKELFFPPFIDAINKGVYSIMPAHNEINGIPCHAHKAYFVDLMRGEWGFNGMIVSDWMDVERLYTTHKIVHSKAEASVLAVQSGLDVNMHGPGFFDHIKEAVESGELDEKLVTAAAARILYAKFQLGLFDTPFVDPETVDEVILAQEHQELALEIAQKSLVLLTNQNEFLPLPKEGKRIFVTGPNANNEAMLGDWSRPQPYENMLTTIKGLRQIVGDSSIIDFMEIDSMFNYPASVYRDAKNRASRADVAIVVVGENSNRFDWRRKTSGENLDRGTLELPGDQQQLVEALIASGTPTIVVLINGAPISSEYIAENAAALIEAWEPGMKGGLAIAQLIFGDINPSGRLPITFPRTVGHIQSFYNHKPSIYHRGKYFGMKRTPLFEFGHGLSYTTFDYSKLQIPENLTIQEDVPVQFEITNAGKRKGDEVILVYLNDKISSVTTPVKKLVAFERVSLQPGETKEIHITIPNERLMLLNRDMEWVVEPGEFEVILGKEKAKQTFVVN